MAQVFETIIKGGTIVDGLRTPKFVSDIGIRNGRIAYIGNIRDAGDAEVIDAAGLIVAPGIIDLHTHYDSQIYWDPWCTMSGWHGVTTVVIGNCGFGFAPCRPEDRERAMLTMARNEAVPMKTMKAGMPWDWETFPEFLDSIERTPKGVNVMSYVPIAPVLMYVMGLDDAKNRPATEEERQRIRDIFTEALDVGGCGFSAQHTGPENVQRDYDGTPMITDIMDWNDLVLFAEILRERGEGFIQLVTPPDIAEKLAAVSGRPVVWNALAPNSDQHGAAVFGHEQAIQWLNDANARGNRVFAHAVTNAIGWWFTLEDWNLFDTDPLWRTVTLGDRAERIAKMKDPELRAALKREYDEGRGPTAGGGSEDNNQAGFPGVGSIFIVGPKTAQYQEFEGWTIGDMAAKLGKHVIDAFLDIGIEEELQTEFQTPETKVDTPAMREVVLAPLALPGLSDGGAHTKFLTLASYGTDFIVDHVRTNAIMDLEEAHWRLSTYSAQAAGLKDRGSLAEGAPADIIIYDYARLNTLPAEIAHDYPENEWRRIKKSVGYRYVMVNGTITFVDGECTGATPGRLLRHGRDQQTSELAIAAE